MCFMRRGSLSVAANKVYGVNAVAGFHDVLQVSYPNEILRGVLNVPGMFVAAGVTYSGFAGLPLRRLNQSQIVNLAVSIGSDERNRSDTYRAATIGGR